MGYNEQTRVKNKQEVRMIEQEYVMDVLGGLEAAIEERRAELEDRLIEYSKKYVRTMYTKEGEPYEVPNVNPIIIKKYFFQSINPLVNREPEYSAEKLGLVWNLYEEMIMEINASVGVYVPSISHFCSFAGIRVETFKRYKGSVDPDMMKSEQERVEKEGITSVTYVDNRGVDIESMKAKLDRAKKIQAFGEKKNAIEVELIDEPKAGNKD